MQVTLHVVHRTNHHLSTACYLITMRQTFLLNPDSPYVEHNGKDCYVLREVCLFALYLLVQVAKAASGKQYPIGKRWANKYCKNAANHSAGQRKKTQGGVTSMKSSLLSMRRYGVGILCASRACRGVLRTQQVPKKDLRAELERLRPEEVNLPERALQARGLSV